MTVRALEPADLDGLAAELARLPLLRRYGRDAGAVRRDLDAARARGEGLVVAADAAGVHGLAWFLPQGTLALGGYLRLLAVVPGRERAGVGALLLDAFERGTVALGTRHAFLLVSDFNTDAQRFYARHGYVEVGVLPRLVLPDVDERLYWKRL